MCRNFWGGASRYNDRNRWCYKGEARKGDVKTSPAKNSMDRVNPEKAYLNRWVKRRQNNKIIARRSSLSDWFETWWQMLRNNMSSKKNRLVSLPILKLPLRLSGVTWPGWLPTLSPSWMWCGIEGIPQWLKYLSKAPFSFSASVYFCLSFRPLLAATYYFRPVSLGLWLM